jgi:curved DNA-binding protein CbpA
VKLTLYDILGVSQTATTDEIRRAYYQLAKETHPDQARVSSDAEFRIIDAAYTTLSDSLARAKYDATIISPRVTVASTPQRTAPTPKSPVPPASTPKPTAAPRPTTAPTQVKRQYSKARHRAALGYFWYFVAALIFLDVLPEKGQPGLWFSCFMAAWVVPVVFHLTRKKMKSRLGRTKSSG